MRSDVNFLIHLIVDMTLFGFVGHDTHIGLAVWNSLFLRPGDANRLLGFNDRIYLSTKQCQTRCPATHFRS